MQLKALFSRLRKINYWSISHLRIPFIIFPAILYSSSFLFPKTCVFVTFFVVANTCSMIPLILSSIFSLVIVFYAKLSSLPPPPPPLPPTSCYLLCKIKRNIASKLSLIRGLCFQIQEYEKEIRQLRTDYANSSYEVGICQSGHTSTNQIYPTSETLATVVTTFGCSVSYDWLLEFMATINQSYPNYPRNRCAESLYSYQC